MECVEDFWHSNYIMKDCPVFPIFSTYVDCHDKESRLAAVDTSVGISCAETVAGLGSSFPSSEKFPSCKSHASHRGDYLLNLYPGGTINQTAWWVANWLEWLKPHINLICTQYIDSLWPHRSLSRSFILRWNAKKIIPASFLSKSRRMLVGWFSIIILSQALQFRNPFSWKIAQGTGPRVGSHSRDIRKPVQRWDHITLLPPGPWMWGAVAGLGIYLYDRLPSRCTCFGHK